jgi:hypothetical protein
MSDNKMNSALKMLHTFIQGNKISLETALNNNAFFHEGSNAGIYIYTYIKDPRYVYIGKTNNFANRRKAHERDLLAGKHCGDFQNFYNANNCSIDDFSWDVLDYMEDDDLKLSAQERKRIREYNNDNYHILLNTIKYGGNNV